MTRSYEIIPTGQGIFALNHGYWNLVLNLRKGLFAVEFRDSSTPNDRKDLALYILLITGKNSLPSTNAVIVRADGTAPEFIYNSDYAVIYSLPDLLRTLGSFNSCPYDF